MASSLSVKNVQPVDMGGNKITNVGTPTASGDVATKTYTDTAVANRIIHLAPAAAVPGGTATGTLIVRY
jgi:hypothetical protein